MQLRVCRRLPDLNLSRNLTVSVVPPEGLQPPTSFEIQRYALCLHLLHRLQNLWLVDLSLRWALLGTRLSDGFRAHQCLCVPTHQIERPKQGVKGCIQYGRRSGLRQSRWIIWPPNPFFCTSPFHETKIQSDGVRPMDPLSAASSALAIIEISLRATKAIIEYTSDTRDASADRKILANESKILCRLLERLQSRVLHASKSNDQWLEAHGDLVRQFCRANEDLVATLNIDAISHETVTQSHSKAIWTAAKWSFTKSEVYAILERMSRLQLYANTLLLDDQYELVERINERQEETESRELKTEVLGWLTPLEMTQTHAAISKRPEAGSGRWFLTSYQFRAWQTGAQPILWCPGIRRCSIYAYSSRSKELMSMDSWCWKDSHEVRENVLIWNKLLKIEAVSLMSICATKEQKRRLRAEILGS